VHQLVELVDALVAIEPRRLLVLDLAGVTFFCADGIRALLRVRSAVTAAGGRLVLRGPAPCVRKVLAITGDDRLFEVHRGGCAGSPARPR
jgi:anti-anti-sigma factor